MKRISTEDKKCTFTITLMAGLTSMLLSMACLTGPDGSPPPQTPWETLDSAWKVIDNLELAYNAMDLSLYMGCFREDFEFHFSDYSWPGEGYGKQDTFWGYWIEEGFHQGMFNSGEVSSIELTIAGTQENPWSGDSTGASLQLHRSFDLHVYTDEAQSDGYRAAATPGRVMGVASTGEWYVWKWWDESDT